MKNSALALALSLPLIIAPFAARAAEAAPYTPEAFAAAQKDGDSILVEITASWCPTCKAQKPILSQLEGDSRFKNLKVFDVDFDSQKSVVRQFGATMQSTLVAGARSRSFSWRYTSGVDRSAPQQVDLM
jgi:thioredoxin 1